MVPFTAKNFAVLYFTLETSFFFYLRQFSPWSVRSLKFKSSSLFPELPHFSFLLRVELQQKLFIFIANIPHLLPM